KCERSLTLPNRTEYSDPPKRKREKITVRFKSARQAQRFVCGHDQVSILFRQRRFQLSAASYRHARADAVGLWTDYAMEMAA
ncbi:IS6 family transposase, partial [Roseibium sp. RKSG952]|nr:IS6 family transposase [Roseibium sp. RKSG952]